MAQAKAQQPVADPQAIPKPETLAALPTSPPRILPNVLLALLLALGGVSLGVVMSSGHSTLLAGLTVILLGGVFGASLALISAYRRLCDTASSWHQTLNARAQEMEALAMTDSLTGLWNARYLDEMLPKELARARRQSSPVSLVMVDVDGLKKVNDRFGHSCGDTLLKEVGKLLQTSTRLSDTCVRYGGDEFFILCPDTPKAGALALAKRLQTRAATVQVRPDEEMVVFGLSIGIATFPLDAEDAHDLLKKADASMYRVKQRGGHSLSVYAGQGSGRRKLIGEYLTELGICTLEQVEEAMRFAMDSTNKGNKMLLGEALVKLGHATQEEVDQALSFQAQPGVT